MGFNEIRVNKSREDKEVDKLVRGKLGQDIIRTNIKLTDHFVTELQRLLQEQINDADTAHKRPKLPVPDYAPEGKEYYAKSLAKCAPGSF
ncbi:MAG: hypothetical protein IPG76_22425 [Acidobacteria bacterium]|nr:hypothetical protein [Acidobacteriota bacterium]